MPKTVIITGTRKGIGKHLAEHYLAKGYKVCGCSRREGEITHENYSHHRVDVSDEKEVTKMVRAISKSHGGIDILLNNAGIASMNHFVLTPGKTATKIMETNFFGTFLLCREVAKIMMKKKKGRIVNFTTVAVALNLDGEAIYAASKAAVESLTKVIARELAPVGITVNAIGPTPVKTDLIKNVPGDKINELIDRQAIKRFGTYDDVSNAIDFFTDDKSDFITGQIMYLGGINQ